MQYHYVVIYNSLDKTFSISVDMADAVFLDSYFFNEGKQEWLDPDDERVPFYQEDYLEVEKQLIEKLGENNE